MKLRKATRKRIYEAAVKHQAIEIAWPASAPEPLPGHKYAVIGFDPETRLEVRSRSEASSGGWDAMVRLDTDPIRSLRVKATKGREDPSMGGPQFRAQTEPEQVDNRYQRLLDMEGRQKTAMMGEQQRRMSEVVKKEQRLVDSSSSARSRKAQERHLRRMEAA